MSDDLHEAAAEVVRRIAAFYGMSVERMLGKRRLADIAVARQHAYHAVRVATGWSYPELGRFFNKHHATIIHGVIKHHERHGRYYQPRKLEMVKDESSN